MIFNKIYLLYIKYMLYICHMKTTKVKKAKLIHLTDGCIERLTIMAAKEKTNFKNLVETHLELVSKHSPLKK